MNTVTIIKPDGVVGVNGLFFSVDTSSLPETLRVVQWNGVTGHVEWAGNPNTEVNDISEYQVLIDAWTAAKAEADARKANPYYGMTDSQIKDAIEKLISLKEDSQSWQPFMFKGHLFKATQAVTQTNGRLKTLPGTEPLPAIINNGCWDSLTDGPIPFTVQDLRDLEDAIYDRGAMNYSVRKAHVDAMRLSADPVSYDFSQGWY